MPGTVDPGFCVRRALPGDEVQVVDLLNRVYAAADPLLRARDAAWWNWKYASNPAGWHACVFEGAGGRILGHYGGLVASMRADGEDVRFSQPTDSISDPEVRAGLRNPGVFARVAQAYITTFGGPDADSVMFGLPIGEVYRLGARHLDYWMLRAHLVLVCRTGARMPAPDPSVVIEPVSTFGPEFDAAARRIERPYRCVQRRDAAFLNWRFRDHWERPYEVAAARRDGVLCGYAVYRDGTFAGQRMGLLMDWYVDVADDGASRALIRWAGERARTGGHEALGFLAPTTSAWFGRMQEWGFEADRTPYVLVVRCHDQRFPPARLKDEWYYTFADFDIT